MICEQKLWQSIGEIQELYYQGSKEHFLYQFPAGKMEAISALFETPVPMQFSGHISKVFLTRV